MYVAELRGKIPSQFENMEDILTSNVFSFFKYSTREIFLKGYLEKLGIYISDQEANGAQFKFWPRFDDKTEPDLVVKVGKYYLLIEAKYFSGFGQETETTQAQLKREFQGGKSEAEKQGQKFKLIPITAHHSEHSFNDKSKINRSDFGIHLKWTNWQSVALFLLGVLESSNSIKKQERDFALDLYRLLDKKNLRGFKGFGELSKKDLPQRSFASIFFEVKTAKFRGAFIGFMNSLSFDKRIAPLRETIFFNSHQEVTPLIQHEKSEYVETVYS
jgi:hypothetical protein